MPSVVDELTGALNLITHGEDLVRYEQLKDQYQKLIRSLCTIIEMECMGEYDYILEIYDSAVATGQRVINHDFPQATTSEEFAIIFGKMEDSIHKLEAVDRVVTMCISHSFIQFR